MQYNWEQVLQSIYYLIRPSPQVSTWGEEFITFLGEVLNVVEDKLVKTAWNTLKFEFNFFGHGVFKVAGRLTQYLANK